MNVKSNNGGDCLDSYYKRARGQNLQVNWVFLIVYVNWNLTGDQQSLILALGLTLMKDLKVNFDFITILLN